MRAFLAALSLLSCLPLGRFAPTEKELARAPFYFPLAGLLFAVLFWGITRGCLVFLPLFLAGVTTLLVQPWFQKLIVRLKGRVRVAAALLSVGVLMAILIPVTVATLLASLELYTIANTVTDEEFLKEAGAKVSLKAGDLNAKADQIIGQAVDFANGFLPQDRQWTGWYRQPGVARTMSRCPLCQPHRPRSARCSPLPECSPPFD